MGLTPRQKLPTDRGMKKVPTEASSQEYEVGLRWSPGCKEMSPEAEEHRCWKSLTSNMSDNTSLCVLEDCKV
jgi:hypothetical protein